MHTAGGPTRSILAPTANSPCSIHRGPMRCFVYIVPHRCHYGRPLWKNRPLTQHRVSLPTKRAPCTALKVQVCPSEARCLSCALEIPMRDQIMKLIVASSLKLDRSNNPQSFANDLRVTRPFNGPTVPNSLPFHHRCQPIAITRRGRHGSRERGHCFNRDFYVMIGVVLGSCICWPRPDPGPTSESYMSVSSRRDEEAVAGIDSNDWGTSNSPPTPRGSRVNVPFQPPRRGTDDMNLSTGDRRGTSPDRTRNIYTPCGGEGMRAPRGIDGINIPRDDGGINILRDNGEA